ncbi:MAG: tetratricopeptide repeat protein [Candidatus Obscuribacterales bacterium]|nr:tetratricopeptide repeat protein [Candidatus Obscuribacterales bacterium]
MSEGSSSLNFPGNSPDAGLDAQNRRNFDLILARSQKEYTEQEPLLKQALALAREWRDEVACVQALEGLYEHYLLHAKYSKAMMALQQIELSHIKQFGKNHSSLIGIKKRKGICYIELRQLDEAVQSLRESVLLCQSSSDEMLYELVDSLCRLSSVYRHKGAYDRARSCIKQAYELILEFDEEGQLQINVMEELAAVTLAVHKPEAAALAFIKALHLKRDFYGAAHASCAESFIQLGMCYMDLHNYKDAESCFYQACEILHLTMLPEHPVMAATINKLAGAYFAQGKLYESSFLEQGSGDLVGRAVQMRSGFFKVFDAGLSALENGHQDVAQQCFRKALLDIEQAWDKSALVRVPFICKLLDIAESKGQRLQRKSLSLELEEALLQVWANENIDSAARLIRVARLFRALGQNAFSDACYQRAEKMARQSENPLQLLQLMQEHIELLLRMKKEKDSRRLATFCRRIQRFCALSTETLEAKAYLPQNDAEIDLLILE